MRLIRIILPIRNYNSKIELFSRGGYKGDDIGNECKTGDARCGFAVGVGRRAGAFPVAGTDRVRLQSAYRRDTARGDSGGSDCNGEQTSGSDQGRAERDHRSLERQDRDAWHQQLHGLHAIRAEPRSQCGRGCTRGAPGAGVIIRGINSGYLQGTPTVGFYMDETPFTPNSASSNGVQVLPDPDLSDVERIEVLKGPQSTLYGASALGGLIRVITKKPDSDTILWGRAHRRGGHRRRRGRWGIQRLGQYPARERRAGSTSGCL